MVRANALEDNFNLYYYDRGRHQIAGARVKAPELGQWHELRITAVGDRVQGWLDEQALIDKRDSRCASGRIGLWTKAVRHGVRRIEGYATELTLCSSGGALPQLA